MSRREPLPRWRKILAVAVFIVLVGPFFFAIFYPAVTGTSAQSALLNALTFLLPVSYVVFPIVFVLAGYDIYRRYFRRKKESTGT